MKLVGWPWLRIFAQNTAKHIFPSRPFGKIHDGNVQGAMHTLNTGGWLALLSMKF